MRQDRLFWSWTCTRRALGLRERRPSPKRWQTRVAPLYASASLVTSWETKAPNCLRLRSRCPANYVFVFFSLSQSKNASAVSNKSNATLMALFPARFEILAPPISVQYHCLAIAAMHCLSRPTPRCGSWIWVATKSAITAQLPSRAPWQLPALPPFKGGIREMVV